MKWISKTKHQPLKKALIFFQNMESGGYQQVRAARGADTRHSNAGLEEGECLEMGWLTKSPQRLITGGVRANKASRFQQQNAEKPQEPEGKGTKDWGR